MMLLIQGNWPVGRERGEDREVACCTRSLQAIFVRQLELAVGMGRRGANQTLHSRVVASVTSVKRPYVV